MGKIWKNVKWHKYIQGSIFSPDLSLKQYIINYEDFIKLTAVIDDLKEVCEELYQLAQYYKPKPNMRPENETQEGFEIGYLYSRVEVALAEAEGE